MHAQKNIKLCTKILKSSAASCFNRSIKFFITKLPTVFKSNFYMTDECFRIFNS